MSLTPARLRRTSRPGDARVHGSGLPGPLAHPMSISCPSALPSTSRRTLLPGGASALLALACIWPAPAAAQSPDEALAASLPIAMVLPLPPRGAVVPAMVERWRDEARRLEFGDGLPRDPARAATLYCQAARHGDAESQFNLAWMLTNPRGVERDDAQAAHLFAAAAEQGMPQARRMAQAMGTPQGPTPACLRPPENDAVRQLAARAAPAPAVPAVPLVMVEAPPPENAPRPIVDFVRIVAPEYQVAPRLVLAIMATESNFNPQAVSSRQAQGLMQLIPDTAARFNVRNALDPAQNIRGGMAYLRWLLALFEGDIPLVAAAYNAGERAVERYRGIPPYAETRAYVRKVMALLGPVGRHPFDAAVTGPSPVLGQMLR